MKTILISGPQGTGKTQLVQTLAPIFKIHSINEILFTSIKSFVQDYKDKKMLIIDEVFPSKEINIIKEVFKDENITVIFISNFSFEGFKIEGVKFDFIYNLY